MFAAFEQVVPESFAQDPQVDAGQWVRGLHFQNIVRPHVVQAGPRFQRGDGTFLAANVQAVTGSRKRRTRDWIHALHPRHSSFLL